MMMMMMNLVCKCKVTIICRGILLYTMHLFLRCDICISKVHILDDETNLFSLRNKFALPFAFNFDAFM